MLNFVLKVLRWTLWQTVQLTVLVYVAAGVYGYFFTDRQIFPVPPLGYGPEEDNLITLESEPGINIRAIYLTNPDATYTLLYSHGNGTDLGYMQGIIQGLHRQGFNVLAYDYRGYGLSDGEPSEQGIYRDAEAAYQYLRDQGVPGDRIIPYGFPLGGGPATHLAATKPVAGLILEATFTSIFRVVTQISLYPFDKFPNLTRLEEVPVPILIFHGTADAVIPFSHGQQLAQVHPQRTTFVAIARGSHNNLAQVAGDQKRQELTDFINALETPEDTSEDTSE